MLSLHPSTTTPPAPVGIHVARSLQLPVRQQHRQPLPARQNPPHFPCTALSTCSTPVSPAHLLAHARNGASNTCLPAAPQNPRHFPCTSMCTGSTPACHLLTSLRLHCPCMRCCTRALANLPSLPCPLAATPLVIPLPAMLAMPYLGHVWPPCPLPPALRASPCRPTLTCWRTSTCRSALLAATCKGHGSACEQRKSQARGHSAFEEWGQHNGVRTQAMPSRDQVLLLVVTARQALHSHDTLP